MHTESTFYLPTPETPSVQPRKPARPWREIAGSGYKAPRATWESAQAEMAMRFQNAQQNGRSAFRLTSMDWDVELVYDANPCMPPAAITSAEDNFLAACGDYEVVTGEGKQLMLGMSEFGDRLVDRTGGLLYDGGDRGHVMIHSMATGEILYVFRGSPGVGVSTRPLWVRDGEVLIHSRQRGGFGDHVEPYGCSLYFVDIRDMSTNPPSLRLQKPKPWRNEIWSDPRPFHVVVHGNDVVVATPNHVSTLNEKLELLTEFTGDFKPIALSIDELKRIYLYIETPYVPFDGDDFKPGLTRELWVGNLQGERWIKLPLPGELPAGREDDDTSRVVPPIVGFDHAIYMVFTHGIVALEPDGSKRWEVTTPENVRGAIVTVDDDLIATIGTKIVRIDRSGEMTTLFESTQGELISPPELGENLLYAMTERKVFRLRARVDGESQTKKEE